MPRLFTGLELPDAVAAQVALARGGVLGARWMDPADYHITLRFVGDVDRQVAHDIAETLGEIRRPPIDRPLRRAFLVRRRQAARHRGADPARTRADRAPGRAGAADAPDRARPGDAQVHAPCDARARAPVRTRAVADYLASRGVLLVEGFTAERFVLFLVEGEHGGRSLRR